MGPHRFLGRRRPAGEIQSGKTLVLVLVFLLQKRAVTRRRCPPGGVLRDAGHADPQPPPRCQARLSEQLPTGPDEERRRLCGRGSGVALRNVRSCAAGQSLLRAKPARRSGESLGGGSAGITVGSPAEDTLCNKMCLQYRAPAPRAAAARGDSAPTAVCTSEKRRDLLSTRPQRRNVGKKVWTAL